MKENSELIFSTFHTLLGLKGASGYSYESSFSRQFFFEKANQYLEPVEQILDLVKEHIIRGIS